MPLPSPATLCLQRLPPVCCFKIVLFCPLLHGNRPCICGCCASGCVPLSAPLAHLTVAWRAVGGRLGCD